MRKAWCIAGAGGSPPEEAVWSGKAESQPGIWEVGKDDRYGYIWNQNDF